MTVFELLSDAAIVAACAAAAAGCFALYWRIRRLASTERGIGKAVSEMSRSVAQFEALLAAAEESTREASAILDEQLAQARKLLGRLEAAAGAAASRAASPRPEPSAGPVVKDPLSDVVPRGIAAAEAPGRRAAAGSAAPDGDAQKRLAELALRRFAAGSGAAAGLRRAAGA